MGPEFLFIPLGIIVIGLIIWAIVHASKKEKERRAGVMAWASENGYEASLSKDPASRSAYSYFDALRLGSESQWFDLQVRGVYEGLPFLLFDYHYVVVTHTKDGTQRSTHYLTACIIETGLTFPAELKLRPENFFDKIKSAVGFNDIDFESNEFSKKFHVKSKDRKFAFDLIHSGFMEYLLEHPKTVLEFEANALYVQSQKSRPNVEGYQELLRHTHAIIDLTPDYFIQQASMGKTE